MTTLAELIGPNASNPPEEIGYSHLVEEWSLAGNDRYGDCTFVCLCNLLDLVAAVYAKPFVIGEAEAELFYAREAGFRADNPATDRGAVLADVIRYWAANGWPSDPTNVPLGWCPIGADMIHQAVWSLGACPAWCLLPQNDEGWDFTDAAVNWDAPGVGGHSVLIVGSDAGSLWIVTWAEVKIVSHAWWTKYGQGQFAVLAPGWKVQ